MRELSAITYPHLRILPITSADNPRNISPQFTRLNIRTSAAPHIRILPEAYTADLHGSVGSKQVRIFCQPQAVKPVTHSYWYTLRRRSTGPFNKFVIASHT